MVRHVAAILMAAALLTLGGCQEKLSDDKANAVFEALGGDLAGMEGTSTELKMDKVEAACRKAGVSLEAFAIYLEANPGADEKLSDLMVKSLEDSLAKKKKKYWAELSRIEEEGKKASAETDRQLQEKKAELQKKADEELARATADFEKKKKELQEAIQKARAQ